MKKLFFELKIKEAIIEHTILLSITCVEKEEIGLFVSNSPRTTVSQASHLSGHFSKPVPIPSRPQKV